MTVDESVVGFLVRAAKEFRRGGYVFTGFHWPVLAGHLAHSLVGESFAQVFEAGAIVYGKPSEVPTSTTDFFALAPVTGYVGDTASVVTAMPRRFARVVLDAGNVDIAGRVNSTCIGDFDRPRVRLPGGGGAPDVAARAASLVWLCGSHDPHRVQRTVEHVTAAPRQGAEVLLHTRWGVIAIGSAPSLVEVVEGDDTAEFVEYLQSMGVDVGSANARPRIVDDERAAATAVLRAAAAQGYQAAVRAL